MMPIDLSGRDDGKQFFTPNGHVTLDELIQFLQMAKDSDVGPDGDSPVYLNSPNCEEMVLIKTLAFDWESVELIIDVE